MMLTTALGVMIGAGIGAGVGASQVLCPDGGCVFTGTWAGGAFIGAAFGLLGADLVRQKAWKNRGSCCGTTKINAADAADPSAPQADQPTDRPDRQA